MVFVADALGAWLVEQLADAGRKKLTELILGSEQERALRRAADAAVWATAEEMSPSGGEQAGQVAMVISEVFRDPAPDAPLAGPVMLLEGLQAGIAGQLAVLDDAELTGTGQSSADVLGVPGTVLADRLRKLEEYGILRVERDAKDRRKQIYRLTKKGIDLAPVLTEMVLWAAGHEETENAALVAEMKEDKKGFLKAIQERWAERQKIEIRK